MLDDFIAELNASNALEYGEGYFELLDVRGVVLPFQTLNRLAENVQEFDKIEEVFHETGRYQAELSIQRIGKDNNLSREEYLEQVVRTGNVMGMGRMELKVHSPTDPSFEVELSRLPGEGASERRILEFWKGAFQRIAEELFGENADLEVGRNINGYTINAFEA